MSKNADARTSLVPEYSPPPRPVRFWIPSLQTESRMPECRFRRRRPRCCCPAMIWADATVNNLQLPPLPAFIPALSLVNFCVRPYSLDYLLLSVPPPPSSPPGWLINHLGEFGWWADLSRGSLALIKLRQKEQKFQPRRFHSICLGNYRRNIFIALPPPPPLGPLYPSPLSTPPPSPPPPLPLLPPPDNYNHRVGRVLSFFSSRRNWDSPTPTAPPPFGPGGEGTLSCGRGVGGVPIPTRGHTLWCSIYLGLCDHNT